MVRPADLRVAHRRRPRRHLPTVLDRLHTLAEPLTRPAAGEEQELPAGLLESRPAVRALDWLLDYAAAHASQDGWMPGDVLDLAAAVLTARGDDQAVVDVLGAHLPLLHPPPALPLSPPPTPSSTPSFPAGPRWPPRG
ncbi:hypothetical protein [Streptomyces sp. NPDC049813]|uniref:hypothetical protein n=1 Tax=Streptomyces sp. NPDC049813 TaxID=3365597 RepID=UPI003790865B